jgi:hypothetical protein
MGLLYMSTRHATHMNQVQVYQDQVFTMIEFKSLGRNKRRTLQVLMGRSQSNGKDQIFRYILAHYYDW